MSLPTPPVTVQFDRQTATRYDVDSRWWPHSHRDRRFVAHCWPPVSRHEEEA
ncbi:hypothetical protein ACN26Z_18470 [Verrucosispora sp. WMMD703]|uniref:hypothetical protein n=1 Tax=Micromonospora TaxID=1873 RepID=UPI00147CD646|nr:MULTISPECIES: hypothetical protein [Micromonospora]WFE48204.1 hypothetical protein O7624_29535 [Verrucosispora sp. WMMD1129]